MFIYFLIKQKVAKNQGKNNPSTLQAFTLGPGDFCQATAPCLSESGFPRLEDELDELAFFKFPLHLCQSPGFWVKDGQHLLGGVVAKGLLVFALS